MRRLALAALLALGLAARGQERDDPLRKLYILGAEVAVLESQTWVTLDDRWGGGEEGLALVGAAGATTVTVKAGAVLREQWRLAAGWKRLEKLVVEGSPIDEAGWGALVALPALEYVAVTGSSASVARIAGPPALGAVVVHDSDVRELLVRDAPKLESVSVSVGAATSVGLVNVPALAQLSLAGHGEAVALHVSGAARLRGLLLHGVTVRGLERLAIPADLEGLEVEDAPLPEGWLRGLPCLERLEWLFLQGPLVGDRDAAAVARCKKLAGLRLGPSALTSQGLVEALSGHAALATLVLEGAPLDARSVAAVAGLGALKALTIRGDGLTDEHLAKLGAGLPALAELDVSGASKLTPGALDAFARARPGVQFRR